MAMNQKLLRPKKPAVTNSILTESGNKLATESGNKITKE